MSLPALFVVGPTGSGKTRLAVDLARACNGEVVNADVIQMYAGLDIASAKASTAERRGVPHHLLSFLPPCAAMTVRVFRSLATAVIADIHARGRVPIIAGGTGYYVQALLRESLLEEAEAEALAASEAGAAEVAVAVAGVDGGVALAGVDGGVAVAGVDAGSTSVISGCGDGVDSSGVALGLHDRLKGIDPVMARRLHPNDVRRISRALAVHAATGVAFSTLLAQQAARIEGAPGPYRSRVYWLTVDDRAEHDRRLDERVTHMLRDGLATEIASLRSALTGKSSSGAGAAKGLGGASGMESIADGAFVGVGPHHAREADEPSELTLRIVAEHAALITSAQVGGVPNDDRTDKLLPAASVYAATLGELEPQGSYVGVLRAIGYKEFQEFLELTDSMGARVEDICAQISAAESVDATALVAPPLARKRARGAQPTAEVEDPLARARAALHRGAARLREVTHGYARRQDRWIRNRFESRGVPLVRLDTSSTASGAQAAAGPLDDGRIVKDAAAWLAGAPASTLLAPTRDCGTEGVVRATSDLPRIIAWEQHTCDVCGGRLINGALAWSAHIKSKTHKNASRRAAAGIRPSTESAAVRPLNETPRE